MKGYSLHIPRNNKTAPKMIPPRFALAKLWPRLLRSCSCSCYSANDQNQLNTTAVDKGAVGSFSRWFSHTKAPTYWFKLTFTLTFTFRFRLGLRVFGGFCECKSTPNAYPCHVPCHVLALYPPEATDLSLYPPSTVAPTSTCTHCFGFLSKAIPSLFAASSLAWMVKATPTIPWKPYQKRGPCKRGSRNPMSAGQAAGTLRAARQQTFAVYPVARGFVWRGTNLRSTRARANVASTVRSAAVDKPLGATRQKLAARLKSDLVGMSIAPYSAARSMVCCYPRGISLVKQTLDTIILVGTIHSTTTNTTIRKHMGYGAVRATFARDRHFYTSAYTRQKSYPRYWIPAQIGLMWQSRKPSNTA